MRGRHWSGHCSALSSSLSSCFALLAHNCCKLERQRQRAAGCAGQQRRGTGCSHDPQPAHRRLLNSPVAGERAGPARGSVKERKKVRGSWSEGAAAEGRQAGRHSSQHAGWRSAHSRLLSTRSCSRLGMAPAWPHSCRRAWEGRPGGCWGGRCGTGGRRRGVGGGAHICTRGGNALSPYLRQGASQVVVIEAAREGEQRCASAGGARGRAATEVEQAPLPPPPPARPRPAH